MNAIDRAFANLKDFSRILESGKPSPWKPEKRTFPIESAQEYSKRICQACRNKAQAELNQAAQDAYAAAHAEAYHLAGRIIENLENLPAPDDATNWGHVGNLNALIGDLRRALNLGEEE